MSKQPTFGGWFQCRNLDKPEWEAFKTIRTAVLPQVTTRDTMHVLVRLAADVAREPNGRERLLEIHRQRCAVAPSETPPLITSDAVASSLSPERWVAIPLHYRHTINGVVYGPGTAVDVPVDIVGDLLMADRRANAVLPRDK